MKMTVRITIYTIVIAGCAALIMSCQRPVQLQNDQLSIKWSGSDEAKINAFGRVYIAIQPG